MRVEKVLTVSRMDHSVKAIDLNNHLTGDEHVSMVEDLREEITKVTHIEYPQRLRRVLKIIK